MWHRENGVEELLKPKRKPKTEKVKKESIIIEQCVIVDAEEDQPNVFSPE